MKWRDIKNIFKRYKRECSKPLTTDELVDAMLKGIEDSKDLFAEYTIID